MLLTFAVIEKVSEVGFFRINAIFFQTLGN